MLYKYATIFSFKGLNYITRIYMMKKRVLLKMTILIGICLIQYLGFDSSHFELD